MGTVQTDECSGPFGWKPRPLNFGKKTTRGNLRIMKTLLNRHFVHTKRKKITEEEKDKTINNVAFLLFHYDV
jgi:hypothetical protein